MTSRPSSPLGSAPAISLRVALARVRPAPLAIGSTRPQVDAGSTLVRSLRPALTTEEKR